MRTVAVVLGDLGCNLRIQHHAVSLAESGDEVDLVGLEGSRPIPAVTNHPRIHVHSIPPSMPSARAQAGDGRWTAAQSVRNLRQVSVLCRTLMRLPAPDMILVQNPPAVPTLGVAWLAAKLRGSRFAIDWHNLAHSVAAVQRGERHRAVRAIARSERRWARRADVHLTVSQALAAWLQREFGVTVTTVYDRPVQIVSRPSPSDAAELWARLAPGASLPAHRVPLVVCPTNWTPDEDFDLLLEALERAERTLAQGSPSLESPVCLAVTLTGKGALRSAFEARVARRTFLHIAVRTLWLEPADYATWIGMADLGLCVHQSSSGLDLPRRLADFRGAGVPAAAFDYAPVLGEVLTNGCEGVTFREPGELASLLVRVAIGGPRPDHPLDHARTWLAAHPAELWEGHWRESAGRVLRSL